MNDMNPRAVLGDNMPPDPIDEVTALFEDVRTEAENWLDGTLVQNEAQMKSVDVLIKGMKAARKAIDEARDTVTKPLHQAWLGECARWKPTQDDYDRIVKGLVALVDGFKRKLAAEKAEAERIAKAAAWEATRKAQESARLADATNIEATRAAAAAMAEAEEAQRLAQVASKDTVKGLRTYVTREITDGTACARWMWVNDRDALMGFMAERVKRLDALPDGVTETTERRAV